MDLGIRVIQVHYFSPEAGMEKASFRNADEARSYIAHVIKHHSIIRISQRIGAFGDEMVLLAADGQQWVFA